MRFHPIGGGPEDDKDGQEAWFAARIASLIGQTGVCLALQYLNIMPPSRLDCPLSLETAHMGNVGRYAVV